MKVIYVPKLVTALSVCQDIKNHLSENSTQVAKGERLSTVLLAVNPEKHNNDQTGEISPIGQS